MVKKSFFDKVYKLAAKIPRGKVTTYKELAKALNSKAYRAVGTAMNKNPYGHTTLSRGKEKSRRTEIRGDLKRNSGFFLVPCHRVVSSDGKIGGFAHGIKKKIELLKKEGVIVKKGKIENFNKLLYKFK